MPEYNKKITRRDFLNGMGVTITGLMLSASPARVFGFSIDTEPYPPLLTGIRGSHDGSWEAAHRLAESRDPGVFGVPEDVDGLFDLVVVGGGISGLAAAYLYRKKYGPGSKILILDNHADFGGHATRVEFKSGGRTYLGYGGTQNLDTPSGFGPVVRELFDELGVDTTRFMDAYDRSLTGNMGLSGGHFFDRENYGRDVLLRQGSLSWAEYASLLPMSEKGRNDMVRLFTDQVTDHLPGQSAIMKQRTLEQISYYDYLKEHVKVNDEVLTFMQKNTHDGFGIGIDGMPAMRCFRLGRPGFGGLGLNRGNSDRTGGEASRSYGDLNIYYFPDGGATLARLLVRALVPGVAEGSGMEDVVMARFRYGKLDEASSDVRIRLNSTVIGVSQPDGPVRSDYVDTTYVNDGRAFKVSARHTVLACWNHVIPFICPGLPDDQKTALSYSEKVPVLYAKVLIRNWRAFYRLGVGSVYCPGSYFGHVQLAYPVSMGGYEYPADPHGPMVVHLSRFPATAGMPARGQFRMGKYELLTTTFGTYEEKIREQLNRMFAPAGFDADRDIEAITVNRGPHGYAYEYAYMNEPEWTGDTKPCNVGRKPHGRITIANSDAGGSAYLDVSIEQANRAVNEFNG